MSDMLTVVGHPLILHKLTHMRRNFFDAREPHAGLRSAFVRKEKAPRTPPHLARLGLAD